MPLIDGPLCICISDLFDAVFDYHRNVLQLLQKKYILTKKFKTEYLMKKIQCKTLTAANGPACLATTYTATVFFRANNHSFYYRENVSRAAPAIYFSSTLIFSTRQEKWLHSASKRTYLMSKQVFDRNIKKFVRVCLHSGKAMQIANFHSNWYQEKVWDLLGHLVFCNYWYTIHIGYKVPYNYIMPQK